MIRAFTALIALALATPVVALEMHTVDATYLAGTWIEPGSGATCENGYGLQYTKDDEIIVDGEKVRYVIKDGNELHYMGVDGPTFDVLVPLDAWTMASKVQNGGWILLYRCQ